MRAANAHDADPVTRRTVKGNDSVMVVDFDHHGIDLDGEDLYSVYETIRQVPVAWSDASGGFWICGRHTEVEAVLKDHDSFCSSKGAMLPTNPAIRFLTLESDPPEHGPFRRMVLPLAGRTAVSAAEPKLLALTERVVADFVSEGGGDAVKAISERLPVEGISLMADLSTDIAAQMRRLTVEMFANLSTDENAVQPLAALLMKEVEARRGSGGDDFLSLLTEVEYDSRKLTEDEIANLSVGVIVAGHETTMNAASNLMLELARDADLQERLRSEPERIPDAVEESLRQRAPVHLFFRTLTRDVEFAGVRMSDGDKVAVLYASANRDQDVFEHPENFDIDRGRNPHLTFGTGIHRCVGAPLAQAELRLLTAELLRHGNIELAGQPIASTLEGGHHTGWKLLPLRVVPAG